MLAWKLHMFPEFSTVACPSPNKHWAKHSCTAEKNQNLENVRWDMIYCGVTSFDKYTFFQEGSMNYDARKLLSIINIIFEIMKGVRNIAL